MEGSLSLEFFLGTWPPSLRGQRDLADDAEANVAVSQAWLEEVAARGEAVILLVFSRNPESSILMGQGLTITISWGPRNNHILGA